MELSESIARLAAVRDRVDLREADIRTLDKIRPHFGGVDYVIHLAALPSVPRSVADPLTSNAVNIDGTLNVLLAARDETPVSIITKADLSVESLKALLGA